MPAVAAVLAWAARGGSSSPDMEPCACPANGSGPQLMERVRAVARSELREEDAARAQALHAFRQWVAANRDVADVRTDNSFLLRFLRVKKFSLPMAQQVLLKYLNFKKTFSYLVPKLDPLDSRVDELIKRGFMFVLPRRDKNGRRVIFYAPGKLDPKKHTIQDVGRVFMMTYEALMEDEDNQVLGVTHIGDISNFSPSLITFLTPTEFATIVKWGEQSVPMRHKEVHLLNVPAPVRYVYDFARTRLSDKIKNRITMHESLGNLQNTVGLDILPKEYGGQIPMDEMIDLWKKELVAKRDTLLALENMKILSDQGIIRRKNTQNGKHQSIIGIEALNGSFRKLEVD
ncbi:clavesin-2 [Schistocerca piceifrons]|uniref:clavesin-2 n=1 Tax=Schistocerca piceifrons TaxID=274613 RepID=UPI001F5EC320|nr:clavesin-2 [Schistocerca piceifrons]